ncbi:MAG: hypothetical protein U9Q03_01670 [Patescibacteria group bacterium]|nr:hypothetical protein [Patescibacteria group bacterium]
MSWNRKEKYQDLLAMLRKERRYGVLRCLGGENGLHSRQTRMVSLFTDAVKAGDDEGAATAACWVMQATEDIHFLPLVGENGEKPRGEEDRAARITVDQGRAGEARDLWSYLPDKRDKEIRIPVNEDYDMERRVVDAPAMLGTKKLLLTEIVRRWRETKDEEEADKLFAFLIELHPRFKEDRDMQLELMRKEGTRNGFPPERAARHYLELSERFPVGANVTIDEISRLLSIAWIRNSTDTQRTQFMRAVMPVIEFSKAEPDPVFVFLAKTAEKVAEIARQVELLKRKINPDRWSKPVLKIEYLFDRRMTRKAEQVPRLKVRLTVEYSRGDFSAFFATSGQEQFKEEKAHEKFGELKGLVKEWQDTEGIEFCPVILELVVPNKYKPEEPTFRRETTIA